MPCSLMQETGIFQMPLAARRHVAEFLNLGGERNEEVIDCGRPCLGFLQRRGFAGARGIGSDQDRAGGRGGPAGALHGHALEHRPRHHAERQRNADRTRRSQ